MKWPLKTNVIRRGMLNHTFGMVRKDAKGNPKPHGGWDFQAPIGTPIQASLDGYVNQVYTSSSFGLVVITYHPSIDRFFAYCHLSEAKVKSEDLIKEGDLLGSTGESGNAKGMPLLDQHLHFEVRLVARPGLGLAGRESPLKVFGVCPLKESILG